MARSAASSRGGLRNPLQAPYLPPMNRSLSALAALTLSAVALAGCQKADDAAFGQRVRAYLLQNAEVIREAALKLIEND